MSKGTNRTDTKNPLLQGTLDLLVLRVLCRGPLHGFGISRRLSELSKDWLQVDEGSLYPCLYRMEDRGWVRSEVALSEHKRRARYYTITDAGNEELESRTENWRQLTEAISAVLKKG